MSDPLKPTISAWLLALEGLEPPSTSVRQEGPELFLEVLLAPVLLLLLAALAGGLRTLLASPLRESLLAGLPEPRRRRLGPVLEGAQALVLSAGLVRFLAFFAAVVLLVLGTASFSATFRWVSLAAAFLLGGGLLEGFPVAVAQGRGIRLVLLVLPLVRLLSIPLKPLEGLVAAVLRGAGIDPKRTPESTLAADMLNVAHEADRQEVLGETERRMISRIVDLPDTDAAEVMTPRTSLVAVSATATVSDALDVCREHGFSRVPVYQEDLDHVTGVFYIKDVLGQVQDGKGLDERVAKVAREPYFVPETMRVPALFEEMRRRRQHLAMVVDEYGGTAGVVTIEDLLEEIVGDIHDEYDPAHLDEPIQSQADGSLLVEGGLGMADLNEALGTVLPEDQDFDTVAGMLMDHFGHIPQAGESYHVDGVILEVVEADDRRVHKVRVTREASGLPRQEPE